MKRNFCLAVAAMAFATLATSAQASPRHSHSAHVKRHAAHHAAHHTAHRGVRARARASYAGVDYAAIAERRVGDPRPRAWCGWQMRRMVGSDPGRAYNLARNWAHWGRPAGGPAPGVIGVMAHHVFKVIRVIDNRTVLAVSGNDSGAVRTRPRSIARVIAWRAA